MLWSTHGGWAPALAMCTPIKPVGADSKDNPTEVVEQAATEHHPTGNRPDRRAIDEFTKVSCDCGMNCDLSEVRGGLNCDNPDVGAPNTTPGGSNEAYVMTRMQVIFREDPPPTAIIFSVLSAQYLRVQMRLHETRPGAPNVEIAVTACLESDKHGEQHAYEDKW